MNSTLELFLSYVEYQRYAEEIKLSYGSDNPKVIEAFSMANDLKAELLEVLTDE